MSVNHTCDVALKSGRRINIDCTIESVVPEHKGEKTESVEIKRTRTFKVDTGSQITCLPSHVLGITSNIEEFEKWANEHRTEGIKPYKISCAGIDSKAREIIFYHLQVNNFKIKNIELGSVPVFITFDERFNKNLLGMDLLKLMNININQDEQLMTLALTDQFLQYRKNHLRITLRSMVELGIYAKSDADNADLIGAIEG